MRLSTLDGGCYALMVGFGETYVRLGASTLQQGPLVTLPLCTGAIGSAAALALFARGQGDFRAVFAASLFLRLLVAALAPRLVAAVRKAAPSGDARSSCG